LNVNALIFGRRRRLARLRRRAFWVGTRTVAPALVATGIWGLVTGVAMVKVGLSNVEAITMTLLVYAGSAQLAALPLLAASAPLWVILLTAAVVNLRFVIFSAALYPHFRRFALRRRLLLGYVTGDVGFALTVQRWVDVPHSPHGRTAQVWFFLGIAVSNWVIWQSMSIAGILLAGRIPTSWGLEFGAIVALTAIVVPMVNTRPALVGAIVAGAVAVLGAPLPLKLGLVAAVLAGVIAALLAEMSLERRAQGGKPAL
jgi:predicted branched-subunit amino acid permease